MTNRLMNIAAKKEPKPTWRPPLLVTTEMRLVAVDDEHDDGEDDHADDLEEDAGVVDDRHQLHAVDVEDRDDDEGDGRHPDLVVEVARRRGSSPCC